MFIVRWARLRPWTARLSACLFAFLASGIAGAVDPLSLEEALAIASRSSQQLAAQRSSVSAAGQAAVPARELPDPKLFFGVDNLPVTGPDSFSLTRDFMTMRKIGLMQDFPRAQKRELKGHLAEQMAAREAAMLVDSQAALRREVALAWMQRYFAERMSSLVTEQIAETELQREALRAGVKSSRTQPADLLSVEVGLQSLLDRRAQYDKEAARAKASLSRWLADAPERPLAELVLPASAADAGGSLRMSSDIRTRNRSSARSTSRRRRHRSPRPRPSRTGASSSPTRSADRASPTWCRYRCRSICRSSNHGASSPTSPRV